MGLRFARLIHRLKDSVMPVRTKPDIYDEVLEALPIDSDGILAFKLPRKLQCRLSTLAARNRLGTITATEQLQLQKFLALEATTRALKSKALVAKCGTRR
jgi:hypothetical protein